MANETPVAPAPTVAGNIANAIQDKASGIKPTQSNREAFIDEAGKKSPTPAPVDPNAGKEKYTVDGKDIWLLPEQARAYVQKGIAFEPKVTQLGHLQHEMGSFMQALSQDPLKILTDKRIGLTPEAVLDKLLSSGNISEAAHEKIGNWYYQNVVVPMKMTPEEREAAETKKKLSEYESREASARDMAIKMENQRRVDMALEQIKANISEAMKESGLPNNDTPTGAMIARRVADVMRLGYFQKQVVTPKQAIAQVKQELKQLQSGWFDHLDPDALVQEIGETNAKKVQQYFLKLVKESEKKIPERQKTPSTTKRGERETINSDDMADYLAELKRVNAPTKFK